MMKTEQNKTHGKLYKALKVKKGVVLANVTPINSLKVKKKKRRMELMELEESNSNTYSV